jgi:hypothetical protein
MTSVERETMFDVPGFRRDRGRRCERHPGHRRAGRPDRRIRRRRSRSATALSVGPARVRRIPATDLLAVVSAERSLDDTLRRVIARRQRESDRNLVEVVTAGSYSRLVRFCSILPSGTANRCRWHGADRARPDPGPVGGRGCNIPGKLPAGLRILRNRKDHRHWPANDRRAAHGSAPCRAECVIGHTTVDRATRSWIAPRRCAANAGGVQPESLYRTVGSAVQIVILIDSLLAR